MKRCMHICKHTCAHTHTPPHQVPPSSPSPTAENTHRPHSGPLLGLAHQVPRGTCLRTLVFTHPANTPILPHTHIYTHGLTNTGMPDPSLCHRTAHQLLSCNKAVLVSKNGRSLLRWIRIIPLTPNLTKTGTWHIKALQHLLYPAAYSTLS